ncbi:hypothetical protein ACFPIF_10290 [Brevundimonas faecalis]|uniref:hypothetical protein n=1 Tax=Brevundimonas faecalis TaxID=947378 RepID=UPI0036170150
MKIRPLAAVLGLAFAVGGCAQKDDVIGVAADGSPIHGRRFTPTDRDGSVVVNCAVGEDRGLTDCRVVSETPEGRGYGAMALAIAGKPGARLNGTAKPGQRVQFALRIRE